MTDEQFDDLAREALARDAGPPSEAVWNSIKPMRWPWLPTVGEILICGSVSAIALLLVAGRINQRGATEAQPNPVVQAAMRDETRLIVSSVTRIPGSDPAAAPR